MCKSLEKGAIFSKRKIKRLLFYFSENYKHTRRKDEVESRNKNRVEKSSFNSQSAQTEVNSASIHQTSKFSSSSQSSKSLPYRHHRQKRSTSYKRNVEVMVAADNKMLQYHGNDLERYILTLMAIVSTE